MVGGKGSVGSNMWMPKPTAPLVERPLCAKRSAEKGFFDCRFTKYIGIR